MGASFLKRDDDKGFEEKAIEDNRYICEHGTPIVSQCEPSLDCSNPYRPNTTIRV